MNNATAKIKAVGGGLHSHVFDEIISIKNLFRAWNEFKRAKLKKQDIAEFAVNLEEEMFELNRKLMSAEYNHGHYQSFYICDPKRRHIHKPTVIDRVLHHAIFRILEPLFDKSFTFDSYSSRRDKGMHKAHERFQEFAWKLSRNNTRSVWILKCDIRKFFDSVDHTILLKILSRKIKDEKTMELLAKIVHSFETRANKGIPLGNLTSQLFSNVYLDVLDQYIKRKLCVKYYIRYADDFVLIDADKSKLDVQLTKIDFFLKQTLDLSLHSNKIFTRKFSHGVDFLGYVIFPHHQILRTKTKNRMLKKMQNLKQALNQKEVTEEFFKQSTQSYVGLLKHCRGNKLKKIIKAIM